MSDTLRSTRLAAIKRRWDAVTEITPSRWAGGKNTPRTLALREGRTMPGRRQVLADIDALIYFIYDLETRLLQAEEEGKLAQQIRDLVCEDNGW